VLTELLDLALPPEVIEHDATGVVQFTRRFGFLDKPVRIRFRLLDPYRSLLAPGTDQDISVTADAFARLEPPLGRVFITENETNFLAFPPARESIVIFGAGYGWEALANARWLSRCEIRYWGDIDTHGFAILDQLRGHFPHVEAFLMDRQTLLGHQSQWVEEPHPLRRDLVRLRPEERQLFDDLRHDRIREALRLEQERIGFSWITAALASLPPQGN
jgi:hypothetical protein